MADFRRTMTRAATTVLAPARPPALAPARPPALAPARSTVLAPARSTALAWAVLMTVLAALLLPARPAAAQAPSMTGAWELTWRSPRFGEQTMRLELVQEGSALAGKAEGPFGELAIRDGQVAGDSVRFYLDMSAANRAGGARRAVVQEVRGARQGDVVEGAIHVSTQGGRGIGPGRLGGRPFVMRRVTQSP